MSIRKYLRKKARHNMIANGIVQINKVPKDRKDLNNRKSKFAENWRKYA